MCRYVRRAWVPLYRLVIGKSHDEVFSTAVLSVDDLADAVRFYSQLGVNVDLFSNSYAVVSLGDTELAHLQVTERPAGTATVYFNVPEVEVWHQRCVDAELPVTDLASRSWGMREFTTTDPSGNHIRIGTNI